MDITGKIIQINLPMGGKSKDGKDWEKQEFIIETTETYPKKICLQVMNEKTKELQGKSKGMDVKCSVNIESREYQGKWFTNVSAWKIEKV